METTYRPQKSGFPYKLLKYLEENGTCAGIDAQKAIGLNAWADSKGTIFYDRASSNFDSIVRQLKQKRLIKVLANDHYKLSKDGKEFVKNYRVR